MAHILKHEQLRQQEIGNTAEIEIEVGTFRDEASILLTASAISTDDAMQNLDAGIALNLVVVFEQVSEDGAFVRETNRKLVSRGDIAQLRRRTEQPRQCNGPPSVRRDGGAKSTQSQIKASYVALAVDP